MQYDPLVMLGSGSHSSHQPRDHEGKQPEHSQPFCTQATILFFTFSTVFGHLHELSLYYKLGFVLDDFAQLQANGSVLSSLR